MSWDCKFDKSALKDLQKISPHQQKRILQSIAVLSNDPYLKNNNIKRLTGVLSGYHRLRIGNYQVPYLLDNNTNTIYIKAVLLRKERTYKGK
jgi:mRNA-degrading endonuclease RelE of RelBE toxin-antitoxin system